MPNLLGKLLTKAHFLYCAVFAEIVGFLVTMVVAPAPSLQERRKRRLLVVRLDGIGDFIVFLDSFRAYRKMYPSDSWEITLLGNRVWADLADMTAYADEFIFLDTDRFYSDPFYKFEKLREIRKRGFDVAVQPTYSRSFEMGDSVIRATGARKRIGSAGDLSNTSPLRKRRADRFYTMLIPSSGKVIPERERNAEFLRGIGLKDFKAGIPRLDVPELGVREVKERFAAGDDYYILFPGAGSAGRQWPVTHFARVAEYIGAQTGWRGIICGGPSDRETGNELAGAAPHLTDLSGRTSLRELAFLLAGARFLVSNETGAAHLAGAVGIPLICIVGGGHYGRFFPYRDASDDVFVAASEMNCFGCNWQCIYPTGPNGVVRCIEKVPVEIVIEQIREMVGSGGC